MADSPVGGGTLDPKQQRPEQMRLGEKLVFGVMCIVLPLDCFKQFQTHLNRRISESWERWAWLCKVGVSFSVLCCFGSGFLELSGWSKHLRPFSFVQVTLSGKGYIHILHLYATYSLYHIPSSTLTIATDYGPFIDSLPINKNTIFSNRL